MLVQQRDAALPGGTEFSAAQALIAHLLYRIRRGLTFVPGVQARPRRHRIEAPWLALPLRPQNWIKSKNPAAPAVKREAEEGWGPS